MTSFLKHLKINILFIDVFFRHAKSIFKNKPYIQKILIYFPGRKD
jgi:hypothetical protein